MFQIISFWNWVIWSSVARVLIKFAGTVWGRQSLALPEETKI